MLDIIKKGIFKVDDRLPPERLMAKKLGVSRPSVREAYSALEIVGILESRAGSGTYVKSSNIDNFFRRRIKDISSKEESPYEIIEVRKIIEPEIVSMAAKNSTKEDIDEIEEILEKMKSEMEEGGSYTLKTDALFHLRIAKASGNVVLLDVMKYILGLSQERLWETIRAEIVKKPGHLEKDIKYHESILSCIRNKDVKHAKSIMKRHFSDIQKEILQK